MLTACWLGISCSGSSTHCEDLAGVAEPDLFSVVTVLSGSEGTHTEEADQARPIGGAVCRGDS